MLFLVSDQYDISASPNAHPSAQWSLRGSKCTKDLLPVRHRQVEAKKQVFHNYFKNQNQHF